MKLDGIWSSLSRLQKKEESLADILHTIPLFADLTPKELKVLEELVHKRTYQAGETVFVETEPAAGMYVIQSGRIDVVLHHQMENRLLLAELHPGEFFGEMALLGDTARSATAVARERSELIGFFHPELLEIVSLHPAIGAKIAFGLARTLAERLRFTNSQLRETWSPAGAGGRHAASGT
jgi:CRP/FNR family cyclic AMP-dependent transcriptional regulator